MDSHFYQHSTKLELTAGPTERDISKQMRICDAKHGNMKDELFEWFCHT
jgi:hypothetical protein